MNMRIQNKETLLSTGNRPGREAMVQILEAGLQAADPYHNARRLIRVEDGKLIVGNKEFEPEGSPRSGRRGLRPFPRPEYFCGGGGQGNPECGPGLRGGAGRPAHGRPRDRQKGPSRHPEERSGLPWEGIRRRTRIASAGARKFWNSPGT